jgi:hypothetical protein
MVRGPFTGRTAVRTDVRQSPRNSVIKQSGKSLKEKRADKKTKASADSSIDISATSKKR